MSSMGPYPGNYPGEGPYVMSFDEWIKELGDYREVAVDITPADYKIYVNEI